MPLIDTRFSPSEFPEISQSHRYDPPADPAVCVIVVTYQTPRSEFEDLLGGLDAQEFQDFESIVLDNGNSWPVHEAVERCPATTQYVRLDGNRGITVARNIGAALTESDLLVFLDDDGVPHRNAIGAHFRAYNNRDVSAARGKVLPKTETIYNRMQTWYDLGDEPFPFHLNIEGNTSIETEAFRTVGGFNERLGKRAGHEGPELTYRLLQSGVPRDAIVYCPDAVIYHDYAQSFRQYVRKRLAKQKARRLLAEEHPELFAFMRSYSIPEEIDTNLAGTDRAMGLLAGTIIKFITYFRSVSGRRTH